MTCGARPVRTTCCSPRRTTCARALGSKSTPATHDRDVACVLEALGDGTLDSSPPTCATHARGKGQRADALQGSRDRVDDATAVGLGRPGSLSWTRLREIASEPRRGASASGPGTIEHGCFAESGGVSRALRAHSGHHHARSYDPTRPRAQLQVDATIRLGALAFRRVSSSMSETEVLT